MVGEALASGVPMERVTIFLRNPLYTTNDGAAHLPLGAVVVKADVLEGGPSGGLLVRVVELLDEKSRKITAQPVKIYIPWAKVDHVYYPETAA